MILRTVILVVLAAGSVANATPGGVDANGCHDSEKIGYHCHPQRATGGGLPGGETRTQRAARLKRECKGQVNAGACAGLTGKK